MKTNFIKILIAVYIFQINFFILFASTDISPLLTISELIDIALENNPSTRKSWWIANRAASEVGRSESAYYPKIELDAGTKNGKDFKFINGPNTNYTIIGADLVLSMMLYDFGGRSAGVNSAKMALIAANWENDWNIQKVIAKVLENTYSTLNAQEVLAATSSSLEEAKKVLYYAEELNRAGLTPISDVYISQATLSQTQIDLSEQKAQLDIEKGKLSVSLGLGANISFELAPLGEIQVQRCQQVDDLINLALNQRGDVMAKRAELEKAIFDKDKARSGYKPKLSLSGRAGANHAFHDKTSSGQYEIALNLNIPIFDGFDTIYQNRIACANMELAKEELIQLELAILLEVQKYTRTLEAAEEMLSYADANLKNSIQAYEGVLDRYKAGKERITEIANAQQQLAAARIRYSNIKMKWLVAIANLAYATGTLNTSIKTL